VLVHEIDLERPPAGCRWQERQRNDQAPAREEVGGERTVLAFGRPVAVSPARAEPDLSVPPPDLPTEVLDPHVDRLVDARAEPRYDLEQRQPRFVVPERMPAPEVVDFPALPDLDLRLHRRERRCGQGVRDQHEVVRRHVAGRRIDQLR
jgi:hypothetical protein